jgi:hypothetical protein
VIALPPIRFRPALVPVITVLAVALVLAGATCVAAQTGTSGAPAARAAAGPVAATPEVAGATSPDPDALLADRQTLKADRSAFVSSGRPDTNFGGDSRLYVGDAPGYGATRSLVYFDFKKLEKKYVVTGGELRLYLRSAGPSGDGTRDVVLYRLTGSWGESDATWNRFPGWDDKRQGTVGMGTGTGWYTWGLDSLLKDWYRLKSVNYGLYVQGYEAGGSYRAFDSDEGSEEPELRLKVEIDDKPPVTTLNAIPEYVNTTVLVLNWEPGLDPEPSSLIDFYEIWYQRNDEPWVLAAKDIKKTTYTFDKAENGRRYGFQVIGVDRAGNREALGPAEAHTLVDVSPPVSQVNGLPTWVHGPIDLTWTGVDLPNDPGLFNSGILHYDLDVNINRAGWTPLSYSNTGTSLSYIPPDAVEVLFRVRALDRANNLELFGDPEAGTKVDMVPPQAWLYHASGVDRPTFRVRWDGADTTSGLASFDVQYRVGNGSWQAWVTESADRFRDFTGEYDRHYGFRVRARDVAGNVSAWPEKAQMDVAVINSARLTHPIWMPLAHTRNARR